MNYSQIIKLVGREAFYDSQIFPASFIRNINIKKFDDYFIHEYSVKSNISNDLYDVKIKNNGEKIFDFFCSCNDFQKNKTCKHVSAVLLRKFYEIARYEVINEKKISKGILNFYAREQKHTTREKLNISLELEASYNDSLELKVYIGNGKKYKISTVTKLNSFLKAYTEEECYKFGKNLTYDPNTYYFDKCDQQLLEFLSNYVDLKTSYYFSNRNIELSDRELSELLKIIKEKGFEFIGYGHIYNSYQGMPTEYVLDKKDNDYVIKIKDLKNYVFLDYIYKFVIYNHNIYTLNKDESNYIYLLKQNKIEELVFEKENICEFSTGLFNKLKNNITISDNVDDIIIPVTPDVKLYFDISYQKLICNITFKYKNNEINYFDKTDILRDTEYEETVVKEIIDYNFIEEKNRFILKDSDEMYSFLDETLNKLSDKYEVFTSKKIDNTNILKNITTNNNFSIGQNGIMSYKFNAEGIDQEELNSVFAALKQKKRYYKLKNNNVVSLADNENINKLNNLINDLELTSDDIKNGEVEVPKYRALYIDSLKESKYTSIETNNSFDKFISNFKKYKNIKIKLLEKDEKILRDYQKEGVKWLYTIYKCDLGGILADEMGLGKSIQTIMFIKQVLKEKPDVKIMIVVPTSLVYNWQNEFEKFAPDLKYVVVADNKKRRKEIIEKQDEYNIFITSYGLVRNDKDEYENMDFELCIVDEAQNIKNYQAIMTKEIKKIKAKCKIALTGTPLENNITELWSIFDYIMPGYLNSITKFREKYNIKDTDENSLKIIELLNHQIKPFILRRKKSDVIKSLPEKIENKVYIDLPKKQKMLYLKVLNDTKKEMDELIGQGGFQKSKMKILQLLTKLRQICIDPSVMYDNYNGESIKIDELISIVKENVENGHKVLIFSSFKRVLDNVSKKFNENNLSYYMINGSVKGKDRMDMVDRFNRDETNCFLITLKSGGTGLNLVGADVVIHLDIWWNPQVENQATDRAHRIGQKNKVSVIKLITKGTIEERIIELQEKKKQLSDNLIEGKNNTANLTSLTEKDIKSLLSIGE